ncbi:MAG: tetratricopeptide repeat protein [Endomicrobiia bacterium]
MKSIICLTISLLIFLNMDIFCSVKDDVNKGNKYYFKQKYDEALKKYSEAELRDPDSAIIHFNSGDVLYRQGQYEEAIKKYQKALNLTKDKKFKSNILYNLGNANYKLQDVEKAREYYKQSLILNPNNTSAKYNLQQLLFVSQQQQQQDKKSKNDKSKKEEQQKSDEQKSSQQKEERKYMSKQDVERLLEMAEQQNKDKQNILKPQKPKIPDVEYDW